MPQLSSWGAHTRAATSSPPLAPPLQRAARLPREPLQPRHLPPLEADPHQVVRLAFLEVGPAPDRRHGRNLRVLAVVRAHLDRRREVAAYREQAVDDLEVVQPVDTAERAEEAELQLRVVAQEGAGLDQLVSLHLRPLS